MTPSPPSPPLRNAPKALTPRPARSLLDPAVAAPALRGALHKLAPTEATRNPVMFVVWVGSVLTSLLLTRRLLAHDPESGYVLQITAWLWLTVFLAAFAEALAEGRGRAHAETLRTHHERTRARLLGTPGDEARSDHPASDSEVPRHASATAPEAWQGARERLVSAAKLQRGDVVRCGAGDVIPADGEVIAGLASIDESAITGESAPVIRAAGGDQSAVTGGTRVLSDCVIVRVTSEPGGSFVDHMIALVEGARRQPTPSERVLNTLLSALSLAFLLVVTTLLPLTRHASPPGARPPSLVELIALLVCLTPTTIGGLLSAIGIAGLDRVCRHNVLAASGHAIEAAGDVSTLLLDKTGTVTWGNRQAVTLIPCGEATRHELARAAWLASSQDPTAEGRSIAELAGQELGAPEPFPADARFIPFSAQTRMSGIELGSNSFMKGAADSVARWVAEQGGEVPAELDEEVEKVARSGGTPLVVASRSRPLGIVHLKDVVKGGVRERLARLRSMGIRTVMITGDNPQTAAAIAAEAGVDSFVAQATPEAKLQIIRDEQAQGRLVAMAGDGTNDAPALAQADVGMAMQSGTSAAREAGNLLDLDSDPTKLIEIVQVGRQLLVTRGALTTFSIANDVAKYFAILPSIFADSCPELDVLNIMRLHSPQSAVLASVMFNALILLALTPLALRGVGWQPTDAGRLLRRNLTVYGFGGLIAPFPGIWLCDRLLQWLGWA